MMHISLSIILLVHFALPHHFSIFHANDVHGWINGHKKIPKLDATYADYQNMLFHLKQAQDKDQTVFAFDSGDLTQGTGLSDATKVPGEFIFEMHQKMDIDASTIGNHELYDNEVINHIADHVYPKMNKTYISGNVRYKDDTKKLSDPWVVKAVEGVGNVLIVGFLYNFKGHGTDCVVDDVEATLNDNKYAGIIAKTNPVLIIGVLHSPPEEQETKTIQEKLAALTDNLVPIILLCGHDHKQHSDITTTKGVFESKCFFEMLSDIEFDLNPANSLTNSQFRQPISSSGVHILNPTRSTNSPDRSFVISNLAVKPLETSVSAFQQRANIKPAAWETEKGKQIREATDAKAKELGLSSPLGCAPQTYYGLFKMPLETKKNVSLYTLYVNEIYPKMNPFPNPKKKDADKKTSLPSVVYIMNSASIRSHLYKGEIYRDDIYSVEPFTNNFAAIRDISLADMRKLINYEATTGASNTIKNVTQKSCWKKCISTKEMTKFQTMHDYLTTVQFRGGEAERKSEIARFMLTVKQTLAHCWASSVSMSEAELMEGCADVGDVCTQFESCYDHLALAVQHPSLFSNKYRSFNSSFKITNFTLPNPGKETPEEQNHKFDIVTNAYDAKTLSSMLNEVTAQATPYEVAMSTIVCRDVFEKYIATEMKCRRVSLPATIGIIATVSGTLIAAAVIVLLVVMLRRRNKTKTERVTAVDDLLDDKVKYSRVNYTDG